MSTSNDRYKSIPIEFLKADFGYSKMGRCVTYIVPKSEAERLEVKVGWLEENVERRAISNHTKWGRNKSESKTLTYIVHFLAPRRQFFYKVVWKALASTHCKMDHVQRKIVGSVELGIVLWVMDIVNNRALVACPKSGWNRDVSGWLPNQPFAWLSIRANDGTDILKNISESELYTSVRLSSLSRSSSKTTTYPRSYCWRKAGMKLPVIYSTEHFQSAHSHYPGRKSATHNKLRQNEQSTKLSHLTPSHVGRIGSCRPITRDTFTTSSLKHSQKVFIDLKFKETKENSLPKNCIPLNFNIETALSHQVESQVTTSSKSRKNSKDSLTRSKTLSDSYVPEAQTKGQEAREMEDPNSYEKRVSVSYCDGKLNSKNIISRSSKLCDEDILLKNATKRKHRISKDNLTALIPGSKKEIEGIESGVGRRSSTESKLTHGSLESKHTSRNKELSDQRCGISQKESTRKQKIKEIETFAKWLAQGFETPMSSFKQAKDKTSSVRIGKHFKIENEKHQHLPSGLIKLHNVKKHRTKFCNRIVNSGIFPINNSKKPQATCKMNAPFRFNNELLVREKHGHGLICSANV